MTTLTDAELVGLSRAGDRQAFGELVRRYGEMVHATCRRLAGQGPDAEDLAHDALVEAFVKLGQLRDPQRFGGWLKTLTLNVFRMWYRRQRMVTVEAAEDLAGPDDADDSWVRGMVSRVLPRLTAPHRIVLALHYLEELSYEDMAALLDLPVGTVMSRLHRARLRLKELAANYRPGRQCMETFDDMIREVDAEISVLQELFREQPEAVERLSSLLDRTPERLAQFIAGTQDQEVLRKLGLLLPRLGEAALRIGFDICFSGAGPSSENAVVVLEALLGSYATVNRPHGGIIPVHAYLVADQLIAHPALLAGKAELLMRVLPSCRDKVLANTLRLVLLSFGAPGEAAALRRFQALHTSDELRRNGYVVPLLRRMGTPLYAALAERLAASHDSQEILLCLVAADTIGQTLYIHGRQELSDPGPVDFMAQARRMPALRLEDVDVGARQGLTEAIKPLLGSPEVDIRDASIRALGAIYATGHAERIRGFLGDPALSTRMSAIRAVTDLNDASSAEALMHLAQDGPVPQRVEAAGALGRLGCGAARDLLMRLAEDPSEPVQAAATVALGELGGDETRVFIGRVAASGGETRRRAAMKALYRGARANGPRVPNRVSDLLWEKIHGKNAHLRAHVSIDAVLRHALPEIRTYGEAEITRLIGGVCVDISLVRRRLIEDGLMSREGGVYEFTRFGQAAWRVERFIGEHYLARFA
jgi:RNA polymerase sigma-70 factor (ECF subfamily)